MPSQSYYLCRSGRDPHGFRGIAIIMKKMPAYAWLLIFIAAFRLVDLSFAELQSWDETIHASWGRVIAEKNIWLDLSEYPVWDYQSFRYPPLYVWSMALSFRVLGVHETAARLPSAIAGALLVWLAFSFGRRVAGTSTGVLIAVFVGCNYLLVHFSRYAMTEIVYLLFLFAAFAYLWRRAVALDRWATVLAGLAFGGALMTKGVVALIYPAAGALFAVSLFLRDRASGRTVSVALILSTLLGLGIAAPWHGAMYALHGMNFIQEAFLLNVVERVMAGVENQQKSLGPFYYLNQLPIRIPFAFTLFAASVATALLSLRPPGGESDESAPRRMAGLLFLSWFAVALALFSFAESKQVQYTPPIVLPALVLAGLFAGDLWRGNRWRGFAWLATAAPFILGWAAVTPARLAVKRVAGAVLRARMPEVNDALVVAGFTCAVAVATLALFWAARRFASAREVASARQPGLSPRHFLTGIGGLALLFALYRAFVFEPARFETGAVATTRYLEESGFARAGVVSAWMDPPLIYYTGVPKGSVQRERFELVQPSDLESWTAGPAARACSHVVIDRPDFREVDRWGGEFYGDELARAHTILTRSGWTQKLENSHYEVWVRETR